MIAAGGAGRVCRVVVVVVGWVVVGEADVVRPSSPLQVPIHVVEVSDLITVCGVAKEALSYRRNIMGTAVTYTPFNKDYS